MTWLFRAGGWGLLAFGAMNLLVAGVAVADREASPVVWLVLIVGGLLAMGFGGFHAFARVEYGEPEDWD